MSADKIEMRSRAQLLRDIEELRARLEEAEQTLQAIRSGEVDALIVEGPQGEQVFSLTGVESVYRAIVETMNEAALTVSPQGMILYCNQQFSEFMKKPIHEAVGRELADFVEVEHRATLAELIMQAQIEPSRRRLSLRSADGAYLPVQFSASLLNTATNPCICLVASDLTQLEASADWIRFLEENQEALKASQEKIQASERKFRALFENSLDAVFLAIPDGTTLAANPAACAMTGWTEEELCEMGRSAILDTNDPRLSQALEERKRTGRFQRRELTAIRKDRSRIPVEVDSVIIPGDPIRSFTIMRDITERKQAEDAVRTANEELEERVQERTAELRERAEQLARLSSQLTTTEQRERNRLAQILHDGLQQYLMAAKLQAGALIERTADVALKQSAEEIEKLLSESIRVSRTLAAELSPRILHESGLIAGLEWLSSWMSDKHGLKIEMMMPMDALVLAEDVKLLLFESVRELLLNVVKHARTSSAGVSLSLEGGRFLQIVVSDHGVGFDPARAGAMDGGIGLFSIRERLSLIGGTYEVDSSPGKGASFTLRAPFAIHEQLESIPCAQPVGIDPSEVTCAIRSDENIRILLTDDHAAMRDGLARLLDQEFDFEVVGQASDGQEAVELAGKLNPDVILMDISMPRMNGIDATRVIHDQHPDIRIIGLSLYQEEERAKAMLDSGAVLYLTKTCAPAELKTAIRSSMRDLKDN
jgi:PAS domain S-box-containing protein